ncbi:GNAT superfamily N-acetyltransferase [Rhizomicrobium palustre]|uniref:GNAT superfamily N-acetyltransferase n=1 Tax=Rhizomicrobium palustre TaxID=189966 RepID=A0A846MYA9_9PROT|nr:GNAT family N-acetyltransferase [Rhizomicrobium palustre]NIK88614.1 GNAT superfamily N-acetyltransferase [Rhizomicrobium palustre]
MVTVRPVRLPEDKPALLEFVWGLQRYEAEFEYDRRLDPAYGEDQFADLMKLDEKGVMFLAEAGGKPVGWVIVIESEAPPYVIPEERLSAQICELYVDEGARGLGAGRALIEACEAWARSKGHSVIRIGHLAQNTRAAAVYEKAGYIPYTVNRRKKL